MLVRVLLAKQVLKGFPKSFFIARAKDLIYEARSMAETVPEGWLIYLLTIGLMSSSCSPLLSYLFFEFNYTSGVTIKNQIFFSVGLLW